MIVFFSTDAARHVLNPQHALTEARLPRAGAAQLLQETTLPKVVMVLQVNICIQVTNSNDEFIELRLCEESSIQYLMNHLFMQNKNLDQK